MNIKSYQRTASMTPHSLSEFSTTVLRADKRQKIKTQPSSPFKPKIHRSFFDISQRKGKSLAKHLSENSRPLTPEEFLDQKFIKVIEQLKLQNGFKGACKTNSRNQLLYLQPKKRYQSKEKTLETIKESLYKDISRKEEIEQGQKKNMMIFYETEYNPEITEPMKFNSHKKLNGLLKVKNNSIREKLKSRMNTSEYRQKVISYTKIFQKMNKPFLKY